MLSVTTGVLLSVLWGYGVIHVLDADSGLLSMSVFLSLMSGLFVKDSTASARVLTTGLLIPTLILVPLLATALHSQRIIMLTVFVLISGITVWVRRFGARATAVGTLAFFAYFFTLFIHPSPKDLPAFCLIAAGAAGMQFVMKLIMWLGRHPERELGVMFRELRVATAAALESAVAPAHAHALATRLDRVDTIWRAITDWQKNFRTDAFTNWDADALALRVLDACVHAEEACHQLTFGHSGGLSPVGTGDPYQDRQPDRSSGAGDLETALDNVLVTLDERTPATRLEQAQRWAHSVVDGVDSREQASAKHADLRTYRLAECVLAHARLKEVGLHPRSAPHGNSATSPVSSVIATPLDALSPASTTAPRSGHGVPHPRWTRWRDWNPTSRLAIQAMTATALASVVGEAISATRWYWAVLTAFVVFLSTTTRSGILTRAYRRLLGTVLGLASGIALTFLAHDVSGVLLAICLLCVMGMIYFAPLNYMFAAFFVTTMLVAVYDLLGVLHGHLLEVRLEETIAGCACGVLCAYMLLSTTSRPALVANINAYVNAVDELLQEGAALGESHAECGTLLGKVHAVESAQSEVDQTISAMSAAFLVIGHERVESARILMAYSSRSAVRFAQVVMSTATAPTGAAGLARHHDLIRDAVDGAREAAAKARRQIDHPPDVSDPGTAPTTTSAESAEELSPDVEDPTVRAALIALARFTWVMRRLSEVLEPSEDRRFRRERTHAQ
ncbi:FUSC family protein [Dietzia sp. NPDC055877]